MLCQACNSVNPAQNLYCNRCGAELAVLCGHCGRKNPPSASFCGMCGHRLPAPGVTPPPRPERAPPAPAPAVTPAAPQVPPPLPERAAARPPAPDDLARIGLHPHVAEGERKQLTVMFADICGSTAQIAEMDPEQALHRLKPTVDGMVEAVHAFGGTVNRIDGDGFLALFGAPYAQEDHAVRACRAAEQMHRAVHRSTGGRVKIRVGINSGEVLVRAATNDLSVDYQGHGPAVHLAARMEQLAEPGTTRLTGSTYDLARGFIEARPLGETTVRGFSRKIPVYELMASGESRSRWQIRAERGLTDFVGRRSELERLREISATVEKGAGHVVSLVGEPGIGKSRLAHEFYEDRKRSGWRTLRVDANPFYANTPLQPIRQLLKAYFDLPDQLPPAHDEPARRIARQLERAFLSADCLPAILSVLGYEDVDPAWRRLNGEQKRTAVFEMVAEIIISESYGAPLLILFEDLHWFDRESEAVILHLIGAISLFRIVVAGTYRPDYHAPWADNRNCHVFNLASLSDDTAQRLLKQLLGDDPGLEPIRTLVLARAAGNPFFIEESVLSLAEIGVLQGERGAYRLKKDAGPVDIPPSIQALLAVRIDRLPPEDKRLLQCAAVIGREFSTDLFRSFGDMDLAASGPALDRLVASGFIFPKEPAEPDAGIYHFKHALTHEIVYATLTLQRRRERHERIVEFLETRLPAGGLDELNLLAHHAYLAEAWEKAASYLRRLGDRALEQAANSDAISQYRRAVDALGNLPRTPATLQETLDLYLLLRNATFPVGVHRETLNYLMEARALAAEIGRHKTRIRIESYLTHYYWLVGRWQDAVTTGEATLEAAIEADEFAVSVATREYLALTHFSKGDYAVAGRLFGENVRVLDDRDSLQRFGLFGLPAVLSRGWLSWALAERGEMAEAERVGNEALALAEVDRHPFDLVQAYLGLGCALIWADRLPEATRLLAACKEICDEVKMRLLQPRVDASLGYARALTGEPGAALELLRGAGAQASQMGLEPMQGFIRVWAAEAALLNGMIANAETEVDAALAHARKFQEQAVEAWALRMQGKIRLAQGRHTRREAQDSYAAALTLAETLAMPPLAAKCRTEMADLAEDAQDAT